MKKCPTCEKTFDDSMRFCQTDGTPLIDDAPAAEAEPAFDPYATIVSSAPLVEEHAAAEEVVVEEADAAAEEPAPEPEPEPEVAATEESVDDSAHHQTVGSLPIAPPEDILDIPSNDPLKTMYVSETEMQEALSGTLGEPEIVELQPIEETPAPEPPSFIAPEVPAAAAPPPSPFSVPEPVIEENAPEPEPEPEREVSFDEAATIMQPTFEPPPAPAFQPQPAPAPVAEWAPPPAPDAAWQNQEISSNTPFQPPPAGAAGQNKTLPIVSLVLGIISLCCYVSPITGLAAIITGFLGMKNVNNDPNTYGGKGLAIAGMVTGGIFFLIGIAYYVVVILIYAGVIAGSTLQGY